jgi:hypothetical protein
MEGGPLLHRWTSSRRFLLAPSLVLLVACGGGSPSAPPPKATRLVYTAPTTGTYRLLPNAGKSTNTHLVLDLQGPVGTAGRGVAFHLTADPGQLIWSKVDAGDDEYAQSAAFVVPFGSLLKTKASSGDLQVGALLTSSLSTSVTFDGTHALATVALDLAPGAAPGVATLRAGDGTAVMLPAALGSDPVPVTVTVGTVTLQ